MDVSSLPVSWTRVDSIWAKVAGFQRSIEVDDANNTWNPTTARINSSIITLNSSMNSKTSSLRINPTAINLTSTGSLSVDVKGKLALKSTSPDDDLSLNTTNDLAITCGTSYDGVVKINDKNTSGSFANLDNYPTNWTALRGVPFKGGITMNDGSTPLIVNTIFGYYLDTSGSNLVWIHPAFAYYYGDSSGAHVTFGAAFYINSSGVITKITNSNDFHAL